MHLCIYVMYAHYLFFIMIPLVLPRVCPSPCTQLMFMVSSLLTPRVALLECHVCDLESAWTCDEGLSVFPR